MSSAYFAKRVSWADGKDEDLESQYLIGGGRQRGHVENHTKSGSSLEGHLKGGGKSSSSKSSTGLSALFTHLSFLGILVVSALLINSFVNSVHHQAYQILSIVGIVISCLVCMAAILCLCGLYQFDPYSTRVLLLGHVVCWSCLILQVTYGGLITAYWGTKAIPDLLLADPASPVVFISEPSPQTSFSSQQAEAHALASPPSPAPLSFAEKRDIAAAHGFQKASPAPFASPAAILMELNTNTKTTKTQSRVHPTNHHVANHQQEPQKRHEQQQQPRVAPTTPALHKLTVERQHGGLSDSSETILSASESKSSFPRLQQEQQQRRTTTTSTTTHKNSAFVSAPPPQSSLASSASRTMIGILSIAAIVVLCWCILGVSAVNWPSATQLHVLRTNISISALILLAIGCAMETLGVWSLADTPAALGISYDDVSSWSVYGALVSAFATIILALLLFRLLCLGAKENEFNVLHTRHSLTRRSGGAATSSSSSLGGGGGGSTSSRANGGGVGIVSTRAEYNAHKHQRILANLHTVMFLCVFVTVATITFSTYTYNLTLSSIDEYPKSSLLLVSSILGFASPVFNFVVWVTCYQWRRRILDSNDSDLYSKHSHIYEPLF